MRRAARTDENHAEIVRALRAVGAGVVSLAALGNGVPDLLVRYRGLWHVIEIKDGRKKPSARKLTPAQEEFWQLFGNGVTVATSVPEALRAIGAFSASEQWRRALGDG